MESGGWEITLLDTGMVPVAGEYLGPPGVFDEPYEAPTNVISLPRKTTSTLRRYT